MSFNHSTTPPLNQSLYAPRSNEDRLKSTKLAWWCEAAPEADSPQADAVGAQAPLNLFIGHLRTDKEEMGEYYEKTSGGLDDPTDDTLLNQGRKYRNLSRGLDDKYEELSKPVNWYYPQNGVVPENPYVMKLQPFKAGGYEVTVYRQDLERLKQLSDFPRRSKRSTSRDEQKEENVISSVLRAKKKVRLLIKSMGMDRMLTLTKRQQDDSEVLTSEEWAVLWKKFCRLVKKATGTELQYVAVLEPHKARGLHLHAAISGKVNINLIRKIWYACLGQRPDGLTPGEPNIQYKPGITEHKRRAGLAKYVSKYLTKHSDQVGINKKRYWSSKHRIEPPSRFVLTSENIIQAMVELSDFLGLKFEGVLKQAFFFGGAERKGDGCLSITEESGLWLNFSESLLTECPF